MRVQLRTSLMCLIACFTTVGAVKADGGADTALRAELEQFRSQVEQMRRTQEQLKQFKLEVQRLRADRNENWLTERRAEEIKTLIREVLSDADTRASMMSNGVYAGHDGKKFFLASEDGTFKLTISGHMQFRFIVNSRRGSGADDLESGFQLRRTKLAFAGHIGDPKLTYKIVVSASRVTGVVGLEDFIIGYQLNDNWKIMVGEMKLPFLLEELISSSMQLAVDRSSVTEYFTLDRGQGIQFAYSNGNIRGAFMISDGANSEGVDFQSDATDIAFTGRIQFKLMGDWKQMSDFVAWLGKDPAAFVGAAIHHEIGETGTPGANNDFTVWTVDGLVKVDGWTLMAAINGLSTENEAAADFDDLGILLQIAYMATDQLQPFVRWEHLDVDKGTEMDLVTAGANYFFKNHNAKLTVDVVYGVDPLVGAPARALNSHVSSGLGLRTDAARKDGQVALRTQFQLKF